MNNREISTIITRIARLRNVDVNYVGEILKQSLISGLKRRFGKDAEVEVEVKPEKGSVKIFHLKKVAKEPQSLINEVSLTEAKKHNPNIKPGDTLRVEIPLDEMGRAAIQKAQDELIVKLREAAGTKLYEEYIKKRGEIVTGAIQKISRDEIVINLGMVEAFLPNREQLKTDHYRQGIPIKAYVARVERTPFGPRILLSRSHPEFLKKLLYREIPEIQEGLVEIKGIARAPGFRSKVAVNALDDKIDPVGACVGYKKSRIQNILKEFSSEKVDIVQWSKDINVYITRSLGPAKVLDVIKEENSYTAVVPDSDFAIAIGKKGQNVWLASLLVGERIDVLKESDYRNRLTAAKASKVSVMELEILSEDMKSKLQSGEILNGAQLLATPNESLSRLLGVSMEAVEEMKNKIRKDID